MSKKKEQKSLHKRITGIVEIYLEQRGKRKQKLMQAFINEKVNEIIAFKETLNKKKKKEAEALSQTVAAVAPSVSPSPELVDELNSMHKGNGEVKEEIVTPS